MIALSISTSPISTITINWEKKNTIQILATHNLYEAIVCFKAEERERESEWRDFNAISTQSRSARVRQGSDKGQTRVRQGSDKGQTRVRQGSDKGQITVRQRSDKGQTMVSK